MKFVFGFVLAVSMVTTTMAGEIVPFGSSWSYLNPVTMDQNPGTVDGNFDANWFKPGFDLAAPNQWSGPSPAPFARSDDNVTSSINAFTPSNRAFVREAQTFVEKPISGERLTSYFRHEFSTTEELSNLGVRFLADDGVQFYLNGEPVLSHNCCNNVDGEQIAAGTPTTYTDTAILAGNEREYTTLQLAPGATLPAGNHVLAASVHQRTARDSDMGFSVSVFDNYLYEPIIESPSEWNYLIGTDEPSGGTLDWATVAFDDGAWETGRDGFGYELEEDPNVANANDLIVTPTDDLVDQFSTLYLRQNFNVADPARYSQLEVKADYDDAIMVYVNGQEVVRAGVPGEVGVPVPFDTLGTSHESTNNTGDPPVSFVVDLNAFPGLLNTGDNVMAIQGLNTTLDSSDFVIAQLGLIGIGGDTGVVESPSGDFNGNGTLDAADIDALSSAIREGNTSAEFDLNGDGAVNGEDRLEWINVIKNTYIGDANLDGEFSTGDFVQVFGASQFEDGIPQNSTWETGDWDGDGDFGTSDFVAAFSSQGFEIGPRAGGVNAAHPVPEPTTILPLVLLTVASILGRRRR